MGDFVDDPEYWTRWPSDLLSQELRRLVQAAERYGTDRDWTEEVEQLLRQAFASGVPLKEFQEAASRQGETPPSLGYDEEPF